MSATCRLSRLIDKLQLLSALSSRGVALQYCIAKNLGLPVVFKCQSRGLQKAKT